MRAEADLVIIGGGILGLATAYHLAKTYGMRRITVVEKGYLCGGASGRNGGGIRAQFSSEENIRLMQESIQLCRDFSAEMGINIWFRQGGYLFLATTAPAQLALETSTQLQRRCGLRTELLAPAQAQRIVPELSMQDVRLCSYNPDDGVVFPWPFVWGYAQRAASLGVDIATFTKVTGFETHNGRVSEVQTDRGAIRTDRVLLAAGAWSPEVARLLGVDLPNHPHRHEICSTEPLKFWLKPLVADLASGLYFSQSMRGEIVGGISDAAAPDGLHMNASARFLPRYAQALTRACPITQDLKVLRQWAGCYDLTPDANPIVGESDEVKGFYQASGFMGHGFMIAPAVARHLAANLAEGRPHPTLSKWHPRRFKEGKLLKETMIIG